MRFPVAVQRAVVYIPERTSLEVILVEKFLNRYWKAFHEFFQNAA